MDLLASSAGLYSQSAPPANREFYVAPNGADANPGSAERPFLTVARARDAVRAVNRQMKGDIVVNLRGGSYLVKSPIEFTAADSGFNGFHVTNR